MRQLTYVSTARPGTTDADFRAIERVSHRNNAGAGIEGLLLYDGTRFLQVLEGPADAVDRALVRIRADARHFAVAVVSDKTVQAPSFSGWTMLCRDVSRGDVAIAEVLALYLSRADANTRATFESFARIKRAA